MANPLTVNELAALLRMFTHECGDILPADRLCHDNCQAQAQLVDRGLAAINYDAQPEPVLVLTTTGLNACIDMLPDIARLCEEAATHDRQ